MKTLLRLSVKMLRRNKLLNFYIIIQMAVVFAMTIFMVSSVTSRFRQYNPFREYIEGDGYFCDLTSATSVLGKYVTKSSDISEALHGVRDVQGSYTLIISDLNGENEYFTRVYDEALYKNWHPKMQSGCWLSDADNGKYDGVPAVVYDKNNSVNSGDVLEMKFFDPSEGREGTFKINVIGALDSGSEIVNYNERKYNDSRGIFSCVNEVSEQSRCDTVLLFRHEDIQAADIFCMSNGVAFVNFSEELTEMEMTENRDIIVGISENFIDMHDFCQNSRDYITSEIKKLLPIFVCAVLLTAIITVSVNAITTYKETGNYALYYICGLTWQKTMLISLTHAAIQTVLAMITAALGMSVCALLNVFSGTVLEFHPVQVLVCLLVMAVNMMLAFIMPFIIIRSSTPREILTCNREG